MEHAPTEQKDDKGKRVSREVVDPVVPNSPRCKIDSDHMLGLVGIVATILNLLIVVFVYIYTPV